MFFISVLIFGLLAGSLIGLAGIGGVILVPLLVYAGGVDIHLSIAASVASFFVSGVIGSFVYSKRGVINWAQLLFLSIGAMPGALISGLFLPKVDDEILKLFLAVILIGTSYKHFAGIQFQSSKNISVISNNKLIVVGFITGIASVLSGTGGPLVLVPILTFLSVPLIAVIGLSQAIQIPIALFASIGNAIVDLMDWPLVMQLSAGLAVGTFLGAKFSEFLPTEKIRNLVAALLLGSGVYIVASLFIF